MPILAGRNLVQSDTVKEYIINQTYARLLGFSKPEQALNQLLTIDKKSLPIVGVVKDFHIQSLHQPIEPVIIGNATKDYGCISIKLQTQGRSVQEFKFTLQKIEQQWKQLYPNNKFEYHFLDDTIAKFYESEQRSIKLMRTATGIAVFISCLGLYGLSAFVARQRIKEMAVRKVLGATVTQIVLLLSRDFLKLIVFACLLAWPLAWWATHHWLQDFAYQTEVGWIVFAMAGFIALIIALFTISYQALKTAFINPVKSLRNE
jgi:large-conductance mechanosensitive channel